MNAPLDPTFFYAGIAVCALVILGAGVAICWLVAKRKKDGKPPIGRPWWVRLLEVCVLVGLYGLIMTDASWWARAAFVAVAVAVVFWPTTRAAR